MAARELSLALTWGLSDLSEAVERADDAISSSSMPDDRLTDISLARDVAGAVAVLNSLSEGSDYWAAASAVLKRIASLENLKPKQASGLARELFYLAMRDDAPDAFRRFASHWDNIDLAIDGVYEDAEECVKEFLEDVRLASQAGTPETGRSSASKRD